MESLAIKLSKTLAREYHYCQFPVSIGPKPAPTEQSKAAIITIEKEVGSSIVRSIWISILNLVGIGSFRSRHA